MMFKIVVLLSFFLALGLTGIFAVDLLGLLPKGNLLSRGSLVVPVSGKLISPPSAPPKIESGLGKTVSLALAGTQGTYALVIKNLKTGETFSANDRRVFDSASLYKFWVMGAAYDQIQKGTLKEDEILSKNIADLNNDFGISSEDAELSEGTLTLTVHSALEQMITISHNYAALLLSEKVGLSNIREYLSERDITESTVGNVPRTTAHDVALFLEKLYNGEIADEDSTKKMIDLLKRQKLNDKLPKYLPDYVTIAHKTGELDSFSHDSGIIYANTGDYIIVILSESNNPDGANDRIGLVSKAVYQYFQKT